MTNLFDIAHERRITVVATVQTTAVIKNGVEEHTVREHVAGCVAFRREAVFRRKVVEFRIEYDRLRAVPFFERKSQLDTQLKDIRFEF